MKKKTLRRLLCWVLGCERYVHAIYPLDERADDCDADVRCIRCGTVVRYSGRGFAWYLGEPVDRDREPHVATGTVALMLSRAWARKRDELLSAAAVRTAVVGTLAARGRDIRGGEDTVP